MTNDKPTIKLADKPTREQRLEAALLAINLEVQRGDMKGAELQIYVHTHTQSGLLKDGEKPIYGRVLPRYVKDHSSGTEVFLLRSNALAFMDLIKEEYPPLGYGTGVRIEDPKPGERYFKVHYEIHGAD